MIKKIRFALESFANPFTELFLNTKNEENYYLLLYLYL